LQFVSLSPWTRRSGFTVLEILVALGLLSVALVLVAQVGFWSLNERRRSVLRHEALETAVNILESAQASPWEALTPEWAATQRLPDPLAQRLEKAQLTVRVEPEASRPQTKRVTVELSWLLSNGMPAQPVMLVGLFSARSAPPPGGQP
ncbi:MAG: type II secretion system GspH family protein, partial [Gemmataceae bacterium]|nr:type II secretion system GspH family protein [Gemmataceae bacterium]